MKATRIVTGILFVVAVLGVIPSAHAADNKWGTHWAWPAHPWNGTFEDGLCWQGSREKLFPNPYGRDVLIETVVAFMGSFAIGMGYQMADMGMEVYRNSDKMLLWQVNADRYRDPDGVSVMGQKTFVTPWLITANDGLFIRTGCIAFGPGVRPGVGIGLTAEGRFP